MSFTTLRQLEQVLVLKQVTELGPGTAGPPGRSAYEVAVVEGFVGTEQQWLDSLVGPIGPIGKSNYEVAVDAGFVGTELEWLATVTGPEGPQGPIGPVGLQGVQGIQGEVGPVGPQGDTGPQGIQGIQGVQGVQGPKGDQGDEGPQGNQGIQGEPGKTSYQHALDQGFVGTLQDWLDSLVGPQGIQGIQGPIGETGPQGVQGIQGEKGDTGDTGPKGDQGDPGLPGADGQDGAPGADGADGADGDDGLSAYEVAVANGFVGTEAEWLVSLVGPEGAPGIATGVEFGVLVSRDAGIVTGGYPATRSAWGSMTMSRFFAEALGGAATVLVRVNGALVHGPIAVAEDERITQTVEIELIEGDVVTFDVVAGGATRLWAQIDGGAA